jgi:hypothetical protein
MMKVIRRAASAMLAGVTAAGFVAVAAGAAEATVNECRTYLFGQGYLVTAEHTKACERGASGRPADYWQCYAQLRNLSVTQLHAQTACRLAAER